MRISGVQDELRQQNVDSVQGLEWRLRVGYARKNMNVIP